MSGVEQRGDGAERSGAAGVDDALHVDGDFALRCTSTFAAGDLRRTDYRLEAEWGSCQYTSLGTPDYRADWGTYGYRAGLAYSISIDEPCVQLCVQIRGSADRVVSPDHADLALRPGEADLVVVPAFQADREIERELRGSAFDLTLTRSYFMSLAGRHPELLGSAAEMMLGERFGVIGPGHARITPRMWAGVQRIQRDSAVTSGGSLFFEAAVLELLALHVQQPSGSIVTGALVLSRAEVDGLHAARDLLLERIDDPPTLAELARHAVTNEYKLKRGFKALFGTSPYAFLLEHRLEMARRYLLDTDRPIAEIAYRVGYRDPAHLTNAFRKRYGVRPSDVRRSARG